MTFKLGESGNPDGRKKGSQNKRGIISRALDNLSAEKGENVTEAIIKRIAEDAMNGDPVAARLILDRTIPAYKPVSMPIQLKEALPANQYERATELLILATNGTLTLEEFTTLLSAGIEIKKIEKEDKIDKMFCD